jgi:uncharacterized protein involved in response to NO
MKFVRIAGTAPSSGKRPPWALWQLGFRPFYLLAGAFAALSVGAWALQFGGWLPRPYLAGAMWHAHELLFGYALAVLVGFLFTAGRNWSGRPTPSGPALVALALLWLAGRVLVLTPYGWAAALVNTAFPLAAAAGLGMALLGGRNRRNYFFVGLLVLLGLAQLGVHLAHLGLLELPPWLGIHLGLNLLLFIMAVMGGRVIPMFTNNGVPGANARRHPALEWLALGALLVLTLADALAGVFGDASPEALALQRAALAALLGLCACVHLLRLWLWQPWRTLRTPLVWVLHAAYLWIVLHLALRGAAELGWIAPSLAVHALTVGAVGGLTLGMMTRTARGHTGRPLSADGVDAACYFLVLAAALLRVLLPLAAPGATLPAIMASALLWSAGFGLFTLRYLPVLTRARLDGKPG